MKRSARLVAATLYADAIIELDAAVGSIMKKLDDAGVADNTIVVFTSGNGAETFSWPGGGNSPFRGEKGTTYEGGFRVPMVAKWPGTIKPGGDKAGKPVGIQMHIGRRPIAAFGNSDGDLQMLQWIAADGGARFMGLVHHTDAEREWAYDRTSSSGAWTRG